MNRSSGRFVCLVTTLVDVLNFDNKIANLATATSNLCEFRTFDISPVVMSAAAAQQEGFVVPESNFSRLPPSSRADKSGGGGQQVVVRADKAASLLANASSSSSSLSLSFSLTWRRCVVALAEPTTVELTANKPKAERRT